MEKKLSLWAKIKAYRLKNNVIVMLFLVLIIVILLFVYISPLWKDNEVVANIALAVFTSLLATILAMCAEIYVQFKAYENDQFLEDIHTFGIANLNQDKGALLQEFLSECDHEIWISGYRLILTDTLKSDISKAVERGAAVKAVICPPWTEAFRMVYGEHEKVMDYYFNVFHAISMAKKHSENKFEIRFIDKPIFSDTYKIDQNLVTGPYMHNRDEQYNWTMAKDFFSYILIKKSKLYHLVETEYLTLFEEAKFRLNWEKFDQKYQEKLVSDWCEKQKIDALFAACDEVGDEEAVEN